ncbi:MAG TPA: glycosyltransferase [Miltoncostaeaceae bacterium]|nr:glycosyltransferase [Miltoncostaeaceae bacterium]
MSEATPAVSVCIPTLNAASVLEPCLASLRAQDYPADRLEIVVADGGSRDATRAVAARAGAVIVENVLRTGEAGKAAAAAAATGDVLAFVDSDNILPDPSWLRRMTAPFADPGIVASEPLRYTRRPEDPAPTRYFAMLGMNDPLCLFVGNYDRLSAVTGRWTDLPVREIRRHGWIEVELEEDALPTIGANGFLVRREALLATDFSPYLFDIDVLVDLLRAGHRRVAKVDVGIVHLYVADMRGFARKQRRRIRDFVHHQQRGDRRYPWRRHRMGVVRFVLSTVTVVPLVAQAVRGYRRVPDPAWALHPVACWITLAVYGAGAVRARLGHTEPESRTDWTQAM